LYGQRDEQPQRNAAGVEGNVERRRMPAAYEVLVHLVGSRVGDSEK